MVEFSGITVKHTPNFSRVSGKDRSGEPLNVECGFRNSQSTESIAATCHSKVEAVHVGPCSTATAHLIEDQILQHFRVHYPSSCRHQKPLRKSSLIRPLFCRHALNTRVSLKMHLVKNSSLSLTSKLECSACERTGSTLARTCADMSKSRSAKQRTNENCINNALIFRPGRLSQLEPIHRDRNV